MSPRNYWNTLSPGIKKVLHRVLLIAGCTIVLSAVQRRNKNNNNQAASVYSCAQKIFHAEATSSLDSLTLLLNEFASEQIPDIANKAKEKAIKELFKNSLASIEEFNLSNQKEKNAFKIPAYFQEYEKTPGTRIWYNFKMKNIKTKKELNRDPEGTAQFDGKVRFHQIINIKQANSENRSIRVLKEAIVILDMDEEKCSLKNKRLGSITAIRVVEPTNWLGITLKTAIGLALLLILIYRKKLWAFIQSLANKSISFIKRKQ